jgi:cell division protein FtsB
VKPTQSQLILRLAGRIAAAVVGLLVAVLVSVQFGRVIAENVTMVRQLSSVRGDIVALEKRRSQQRREIARLRDPEGAIPEIHDRLRMVRANETIIFVSPAPTSAP